MNYANHRRIYLALGLLSACVIAAQIVLMQLLSYVQWHHFAYLVISIAMLGFGAAGTCIAIFRKILVAKHLLILPVLAYLAGVTFYLALRLSQTESLAFDLYHLFVDGWQYARLLLVIFIFFLPFFFSALFIGLIFTVYIEKINTLYFVNLVGSGLGGVLALFLISLLLPWKAFWIISALLVFSGLILTNTRQKPLIAGIILMLLLMVSFETMKPLQIKPSQYKSLSKTLNLPEARIVEQKPGILGTTQIVESPVLRYAPGVSFNFKGEIPISEAVFSNADFVGMIPKFDPGKNHPLQYTTMALPYSLASHDSVLILSAGSGYFAAHAILEGARFVVATELNPHLAEIISNHVKLLPDSLSGYPVLRILQLSARSFLENTRDKFNLIVLPFPDAFGGSAGLFAMQENYLMTIEGLGKAFNALKPGGLMAVSCWMDYPTRTSLKVLSTVVEMLRRVGINPPENHIMAIRGWATISFVVGNRPFVSNAVSDAIQFCDSLSFDPLLMPGLQENRRNIYNELSDKSFFNMIDSIMAGKTDSLYMAYPFHLKPATDDKPYFNQFIKWKVFPFLLKFFGQEQLPFLELGYLILIVTTIMVSLLSVILILLPLPFKNAKRGGRLTALIYFAALGLGFMFIEVILIQRFILFLGHPIISATFVISSMLVLSGLGSFLAGKYTLKRLHLTYVLSGIVIVCLLLLVLLDPIINASIGLPLFQRMVIGFFIILIPSFLMGIPFPVGLRLLSEKNNSQVPWAWGINGCLSVVAAPLSMLIAVESGYVFVMVTAAAAYAIALLANAYLKRNAQSFVV